MCGEGLVPGRRSFDGLIERRSAGARLGANRQSLCDEILDQYQIRMVWLWWSRRSRMVAVRTSSPNRSRRCPTRGRVEGAAAFGPPGDELEGQASPALIEWQVAELVDHEQLGPGEEGELVGEAREGRRADGEIGMGRLVTWWRGR